MSFSSPNTRMPDTPKPASDSPDPDLLSSGPVDQQSAISVSPFAYPLDEFYAQARRPLPPIQPIRGEAMPEPYKSLLVHNDDMTPTLEKFHRRKIHLHVLRRQQRDDFYFREVILLLDETEEPVEFGAIKINLALFPSAARRAVLEERLPLGHILEDTRIIHFSKPKAFLRVEADAFIRKALGLSQPHHLYGRRNSLADPMQRALAEIVEILPPSPHPA
jgi:chorismate-pyruvate lyase